MRLIDADALRDKVYHEAFETDTPDQKWDSGCWIRYKMFERNIKNAPTIDAVSARLGRWITCEDGWGDVCYQCSECGQEWCLNDGTPAENNMNYCPTCGADMREGEKDGTVD